MHGIGGKLLDRAVEASLGLALALLVVCAGLWNEARSPRLPGTAPPANFYSVVSDLGFGAGSRNQLPLRQLEALAASDAGLALMGTLPVTRMAEVPGEPQEIRYDFVFGRLLQTLQVPMIGRGLSAAATALPLAEQPVREAVISMALAERMYGSAWHALGKQLRLGGIAWPMTGEWIHFEVVGVADREFAGTLIDSPAHVWVGINGWAGVLFPTAQVADVRRHFSASTLAVVTAHPVDAARWLETELLRLGEPMPRIELAAGAGYHPARRARFLQISQALMPGLVALAVMLVLSLAAFAMLRAQRNRHADRIRELLGEHARTRLGRHVWHCMQSWLAVGFGVLAGLLAATQWNYPGLPTDAAVLRGLQSPMSWLLVGVFATMLAIAQPLWNARLPMRQSLGRRTGTGVASLFALLLVGVALAWLSGTAGVLRLAQLVQSGLPDAVTLSHVAEISGSDRSWMFDPSDTRALEAAVAASGVALANSGPVGSTTSSERAQVEMRSGQRSTVVSINHVSANYFRVLGLAERSVCGPMDDWGPDSVYLNGQFLREVGAGAAAEVAKIRLEDGRQLRVCGEVEDGHVRDARAGLAPMVYAPLRERRFLRAAVFPDNEVQRSATALEQALAATFPNASSGSPLPVEAALAVQLQQERGIATLNALTMALSGALCFSTALMLGQAALQLNLRGLATRRALGSPLLRLLISTIVGRSPLPWLAAATLLAAAFMLTGQLAGLMGGQWLIPVLVTLLACALLVVAVGQRLLTGVRDDRLMPALRSE